MPREPLWGVAQVAQYLGLRIGTVYHLVSQKRIPCLRLSARCLRFEPTAIELWARGKSEQGIQEKS
jgi:excisionase family DNA binding protein